MTRLHPVARRVCSGPYHVALHVASEVDRDCERFHCQPGNCTCALLRVTGLLAVDVPWVARLLEGELVRALLGPAHAPESCLPAFERAMLREVLRDEPLAAPSRWNADVGEGNQATELVSAEYDPTDRLLETLSCVLRRPELSPVRYSQELSRLAGVSLETIELSLPASPLLSPGLPGAPMLPVVLGGAAGGALHAEVLALPAYLEVATFPALHVELPLPGARLAASFPSGSVEEVAWRLGLFAGDDLSLCALERFMAALPGGTTAGALDAFALASPAGRVAIAYETEYPGQALGMESCSFQSLELRELVLDGDRLARAQRNNASTPRGARHAFAYRPVGLVRRGPGGDELLDGYHRVARLLASDSEPRSEPFVVVE